MQAKSGRHRGPLNARTTAHGDGVSQRNDGRIWEVIMNAVFTTRANSVTR